MDDCLFMRFDSLLQLHPVTAFVLSKVQPSQHLWLSSLEKHRQEEFMVVNYGASNCLRSVITGFHKNNNNKKDLLLTFYTVLPRPLKSVDSGARAISYRGWHIGTHLHSWAWSSSGRVGHWFSGWLGLGAACWFSMSISMGFHGIYRTPKHERNFSIS